MVPDNQISLHFKVPNNLISISFDVPDTQISLHLGVPDNCSSGPRPGWEDMLNKQLWGTPKLSEIFINIFSPILMPDGRMVKIWKIMTPPIKNIDMFVLYKVDRVGRIDNRPSTD